MRRAKQDPPYGWRSHWQYYGLQHSTNERASWREHNNKPARRSRGISGPLSGNLPLMPWLLAPEVIMKSILAMAMSYHGGRG
jgi:hypothetical protein